MLISTFYKKINEEFTLFKAKLLQQSPWQVFMSAYEIVYKEEIFDILSNEDLSEKIVRFLLSQDDILEYVYQLWLSNDYSSMENMREVIKSIQTL